jgi:hypothetical protein
MSCCGRKRAQWAAEARHDERKVETAPASPAPMAIQGPVWFEYVGTFRRMVTGSATRQAYEFPAPGAKVAVARPDAAALRAEMDLRVVASPAPD